MASAAALGIRRLLAIWMPRSCLRNHDQTLFSTFWVGWVVDKHCGSHTCAWPCWQFIIYSFPSHCHWFQFRCMCKMKSICFWMKPWSSWTDPSWDNFETKHWQTLLLPLCAVSAACQHHPWFDPPGGMHLRWTWTKFWTGASMNLGYAIDETINEARAGDMGLWWCPGWSGNEMPTRPESMKDLKYHHRCMLETCSVLKTRTHAGQLIGRCE